MVKKNLYTISMLAAVTLFSAACTATKQQDMGGVQTNVNTPKNIIMVISDGMDLLTQQLIAYIKMIQTRQWLSLLH